MYLIMKSDMNTTAVDAQYISYIYNNKYDQSYPGVLIDNRSRTDE